LHKADIDECTSIPGEDLGKDSHALGNDGERSNAPAVTSRDTEKSNMIKSFEKWTRITFEPALRHA